MKMLAAGGKVPDDRIIASILVLALGSFLNRKIPVLVRFNIPVAVTGGLLFTVLYKAAGIRVDFNLEF